MGVLRSVLLWASDNAWMREHMPRLGFVRRARRRFMPGEDLDDALTAARDLSRHGIGAVLTHLGEHVTDQAAAAAARDAYLAALRRIAEQALDVEISVKLSHLGMELDPDLAFAHLDELAQRAGEQGTYVWVDVEESPTVEATLAVYRRARHRHAHVGMCLQAYLFRTAADAEALLALGAGLRLVKGAYREPATVAYRAKKDVDEAFASLTTALLPRAAEAGTRLALATHDVELLESMAEGAPAVAGAEVQMLYGIRAADQIRLAASGRPVRVLIGYGTSWWPWYVRRLAERPAANLAFVLRNLFGRGAATQSVPTR